MSKESIKMIQETKAETNIKEEKIKKRIRKNRIRLIFTKVSLLAMLLIVSTYAWFTSQKDITLSNIRGTVEVAENMEISLDAKVWSQRIDLSSASIVFANAQQSKDASVEGTAKAILPAQLLPVSGVGETGSKILPLYTGNAKGTTLENIEKCIEEESNEIVDNGYYAFDVYIKNTSQEGDNDVLQLNINSAVQVLTSALQKTFKDGEGNSVTRTYTGDAGSGLQNTVRVGLALYGEKDGAGKLINNLSSTSTQAEILNATKNQEIVDIAIWEPNASDHVEYIVDNNNKIINGTEEEKIEFGKEDQVDTYALTEKASIERSIENIYDISNANEPKKLLGKQKTFKTEKTSENDYRINVSSTLGKPLNIKNISEENFEITSNTVSRLRVYVWLEGQDVDCINHASTGGGIELDLGLTKDDFIGDNNTFADKIRGTEAEVYGDYTDYPIDIDGIETNADGTPDYDWRVFYTNGANVFLIADDNLPNSKISNETKEKLGLEYNGNYSVYWTNVDSLNYTIKDNKYMISQAKMFNSNNVNYRAAASLLETSLWKNFVNSKYAESAVGAPTIEMWVESWNTIYSEDKLYCNNANTDGYFVGKNNPATEETMKLEEKEGYQNSLFYPHREWIDNDNLNGYWIASPAAENTTNQRSKVLFAIGTNSAVGAAGCKYHYLSLRPVICLKSDITASKVGDIWQLGKDGSGQDIEEVFVATSKNNIKEPTTNNVTATIKSNKEIAVLPEGWIYANSEKTEISKIYE